MSEISETLFIPLYFRAVETCRWDAIIRDELAVDFVAAIDYDFSWMCSLPYAQLATALRAREFDRYARAFLRHNPYGIVVNLGCGLDTRFFRVDNGTLEWYELDFPEVIALRRQLVSEAERFHFVASSALDFTWMSVLEDRADRPVLFLAEGVLMYLAEDEVRRLILGLKERCAGSVLVFDAVSPMQVYFDNFYVDILLPYARFRWGLVTGRDIDNWDADVVLLGECLYLDQPLPRLGWHNALRLFPNFKNSCRIVAYRLGARKENSVGPIRCRT